MGAAHVIRAQLPEVSMYDFLYTPDWRYAQRWWRSLSIRQCNAECDEHGVMRSLASLCSGFRLMLWERAGRPALGQSQFEVNGVKLKRNSDEEEVSKEG